MRAGDKSTPKGETCFLASLKAFHLKHPEKSLAVFNFSPPLWVPDRPLHSSAKEHSEENHFFQKETQIERKPAGGFRPMLPNGQPARLLIGVNQLPATPMGSLALPPIHPHPADQTKKTVSSRMLDNSGSQWAWQIWPTSLEMPIFGRTKPRTPPRW